MRLFYGLIALCVAACGLEGVCHWTTCAVVTAGVALGAVMRQYFAVANPASFADKKRSFADKIRSRLSPQSVAGRYHSEYCETAASHAAPRWYRRFSAILSAAAFLALCVGDALRHLEFRAAALSIFVNLVWALLIYRSFCNETLSERLQAAVLLILPMACLAFSMPPVEYALFLVVYLAVLFAFFTTQALVRPNSGAAGTIVESRSQRDASERLARRRLRDIATIAAAVAGVSLMGCLLFLVMPRFRSSDAAPSAGMSRQATAGFPDVDLDKTGKIDLDPSLVFRTNLPETPDTRYWIIDTQNSFDGTTWRNTFSYRARETTESLSEPVYRLEFIRDWYDWRLPVLRHTTGIRRLENDKSRSRFYVDPYGNYRRRGWPPAIAGFEFSYTDAPNSSPFDGFSPGVIWPNRRAHKASYRKLRETALEITKGASTTLDKAQRIVDYLQKNYAYSLERPVRQGFVVEDFLYHQKFGHCEVFSTTMAVLLSTLDIGVRNVSGFASSEYRNGYHLVRAAHAHSWVEVQLDDGTWKLFDPTPAGAAQIQPNWRVQLNDWFDSYRSDDLYLWIDKHWPLSLAGLLAFILVAFFARQTIVATRLRTMPVESVMRHAWREFVDTTKKNSRAIAETHIHPNDPNFSQVPSRKEKSLSNAIDTPPYAFEPWYERYGSDDSAIGRFVRSNIAVRFAPNEQKLSGFARFRFNHATLKSMRNAQNEWLRRKR